MKDPNNITPGIRIRRAASTKIRRIKRRVSEAVTTPNVKSLRHRLVIVKSGAG
jgi:hypothetical protein